MNNPVSHHTLPEAAQNLRKRKRAEGRLRMAGIIAIAFAVSALCFLLFSVLSKSFGNFTKHTYIVDIALDQEVIDPNRTLDDTVIRQANYSALIKKALLAQFPYLDTRQGKRDLYALASGEAKFDLSNQVRETKELIGQTIPFEVLASDTADLYYKNHYGALETLTMSDAQTITIDGDGDGDGSYGASVNVVGDGAFAQALDLSKTLQLQEAERYARQARLQEQGVRFIEMQLAQVGDSALDVIERNEAEQQLAVYQQERARLNALADDLRQKANAESGAGTLDDTTPSLFLRAAGGVIKVSDVSNDALSGTVVIPLTQTGAFDTDVWSLEILEQPESGRKLNDTQILILDQMQSQGLARESFNMRYFTSSDSREPELAGLWGAVVGSFLTMLVTLVLAVPVSILASIYLEEFAPKNRFTDLIEVTINNLAAVPSIIFGLLGLAVFLNFFGVPRSTPLAGGIVLALMTLPTVIIASRASIRAVPPSIRDAALGLGASKVQASFHHVLPLALPGMMTGTIIGMAQALGETAPLIIIGMVAFLVEAPDGITDSATTLPVQIFRWFAFPERAFEMRTAAAILILLSFLVCMNGLAVWLRRRFERRW